MRDLGTCIRAVLKESRESTLGEIHSAGGVSLREVARSMKIPADTELARSTRRIQSAKAPASPASEPVEAVAVMMAERSALALGRHIAKVLERLAKQAKRDPKGALRHSRRVLSVVKIGARLWRW